jgi:GntR family transcriptional regulator
MFFLRISASSGVPLYLQIEQQIKRSIVSGLLRSGDALPSTRRAAADLRINPNTVARAFQNLERDGIIRAVPGGGTYIANLVISGHILSPDDDLLRLRPMAMQLVVEATQLRVPPQELHTLIDSTLQELKKPRRTRKSVTPTPATNLKSKEEK